MNHYPMGGTVRDGFFYAERGREYEPQPSRAERRAVVRQRSTKARAKRKGMK